MFGNKFLKQFYVFLKETYKKNTFHNKKKTKICFFLKNIKHYIYLENILKKLFIYFTRIALKNKYM